MTVVLDTCAVIWAISDHAQLPDQATRLLEAEETEVCVSAIRAFFMTLWRPCSRNDGRSCGMKRTVLGCGPGTVVVKSDLIDPMIPPEDWDMLGDAPA